MKTNKGCRGKGRLFYTLLLLFALFICLPILLSLILSLNTLRDSSLRSRVNQAAAFESQIRYARLANIARSRSQEAEELRVHAPLLISLGGQERLQAGDPSLQEARALLRSLYSQEALADTEGRAYYLYFAGSDYLLGIAEEGDGQADPRVFEAIARADLADTGYAKTAFGPDTLESGYISVFVYTVASDVLYIYVRSFAPGERPGVELSDTFTENLQGLEIAYYDSFGNRHAVTEAQSLCALYDYASLEGESESAHSFSFSRNGQSYLCFYLYNPDNATKLAIFCQDEIAQNQSLIARLLVCGAAAALAICLLLAIILVRRFYRPMDTLVSRLQREPGGLVRDDYRILNDALAGMDSKLREQEELLQKSCLLKLLRGSSTGMYEAYRETWLHNMAQGRYAVAALRIDALAQEDSLLTESALEEQVLSFFSARALEALSVWDRDFLFLVFQMEGLDTAGLSALCTSLQGALESCSVSIYISAVHATVRELHRCYEEAMETAEYCMLLERYGLVLCYESVAPSIRQRSIGPLDFAQLQKLAGYSASLSIREALAQYDAIVLPITGQTGKPLDSGDMTFSMLMNALAMSFYDIVLPGDARGELIQQHIGRIRAARDSQELRALLKGSLEAFSELSNSQSFDRNRFEQVRAYVRESCFDPNLSCCAVADRFGTCQSNITRMFKKYTQAGFLEYVHLLRVERALKLLRETDMTVSEIAELVGYTNTVTMNRAFKAYAHTTPSMARKMRL